MIELNVYIAAAGMYLNPVGATISVIVVATMLIEIGHPYTLASGQAELVAKREEDATQPATLRIKLVIFVDVTLKDHLEKRLKMNESEICDLFDVYIDQVEANFVGLHNDRVEMIKFELIDVVDANAGYSNGVEVDDDDSAVSLTSTGNIDILLDNFCQYQAQVRQQQMPLRNQSWHLSLLLTTNDLFSREDDEADNKDENISDGNATISSSSSSIMGISLLNGIHWPDLACLIVEFGVNYDQYVASYDHNHLLDVNWRQTALIAANASRERNYNNPTRGFASTWVAAHEIGHSLGLHHDGVPFNRECEGTKSMMSASSFVEAINLSWSNCSIAALAWLDPGLIDELAIDDNELNGDEQRDYKERERVEGAVAHSRAVDAINRLPGRRFTARDQCKMFASNLTISIEHLNSSICNQTVWCEWQLMNNNNIINDNNSGNILPVQKSQLVAIGPALEGTQCNRDGTMICLKQQCTNL